MDWQRQELDLARQSRERKGAAAAKLLARAITIRECRYALLRAIRAPLTENAKTRKEKAK